VPAKQHNLVATVAVEIASPAAVRCRPSPRRETHEGALDVRADDRGILLEVIPIIVFQRVRDASTKLCSGVPAGNQHDPHVVCV
jgi:hypothetical protein